MGSGIYQVFESVFEVPSSCSVIPFCFRQSTQHVTVKKRISAVVLRYFRCFGAFECLVVVLCCFVFVIIFCLLLLLFAGGG